MRELKTVTKMYDYHDESGYRFTVHASYDQEFGWSASLSIDVYGFKTDEEALNHLRLPLEHCPRLLVDNPPSASPTEPGG